MADGRKNNRVKDPRGRKKKNDSRRWENKALTPREDKFCKEYVVDFNASRAAKEAGYSAKTAGAMGHKLISKQKIKDHIDVVKNQLAETAGLSPLRVLLELKKIAFSSTANYFNGWMDIKDFEKIPDTEKAALADIKVSEETFGKVTKKVVHFKMHDKLKALEMINKMLGYNEPEKNLNINQNTVVDIPVISWTDVTENKEETD